MKMTRFLGFNLSEPSLSHRAFMYHNLIKFNSQRIQHLRFLLLICGTNPPIQSLFRGNEAFTSEFLNLFNVRFNIRSRRSRFHTRCRSIDLGMIN